MRCVVYTCAFPDYDFIFDPLVMTPGVAHVVFGPPTLKRLKGWQWRPLPKAVDGFSQTMANRYCKFFPHRLFPDADITIYVDGNITVCGDIRPLIEEFIASDADIGLFKHPVRSTLGEELDICKKAGKIRVEEYEKADAQIAAYFQDGLPGDYILTQNGIIFRRNDRTNVVAAMTLWWNHMERYVWRDQLSGPYVIWKSQLSVKIWDWIYSKENPFFILYSHKVKHASLGFEFEIYAQVHKHKPGLSRHVFRFLHAVVRRLRGPGRRRAWPRRAD